MAHEHTAAPDSTAVRIALWRAMHVQVDAPPHVFEDEIGLQLVAPDDGWRARPDMDPAGTSGFRAAMVARARFIEELVAEQADHDVAQYVVLGAGLDTLPNAGRSSPPACGCSRSTSPAPKPGSGNG
jgi:O-methyltransferase involved in polyketide biosynthesis